MCGCLESKDNLYFTKAFLNYACDSMKQDTCVFVDYLLPISVTYICIYEMSIKELQCLNKDQNKTPNTAFKKVIPQHSSNQGYVIHDPRQPRPNLNGGSYHHNGR